MLRKTKLPKQNFSFENHFDNYYFKTTFIFAAFAYKNCDIQFQTIKKSKDEEIYLKIPFSQLQNYLT